jgi:hypothetical protein
MAWKTLAGINECSGKSEQALARANRPSRVPGTPRASGPPRAVSGAAVAIVAGPATGDARSAPPDARQPANLAVRGRSVEARAARTSSPSSVSVVARNINGHNKNGLFSSHNRNRRVWTPGNSHATASHCATRTAGQTVTWCLVTPWNRTACPLLIRDPRWSCVPVEDGHRAAIRRP